MRQPSPGSRLINCDRSSFFRIYFTFNSYQLHPHITDISTRACFNTVVIPFIRVSAGTWPMQSDYKPFCEVARKGHSLLDLRPHCQASLVTDEAISKASTLATISKAVCMLQKFPKNWQRSGSTAFQLCFLRLTRRMVIIWLVYANGMEQQQSPIGKWCAPESAWLCVERQLVSGRLKGKETLLYKVQMRACFNRSGIIQECQHFRISFGPKWRYPRWWSTWPTWTSWTLRLRNER